MAPHSVAICLKCVCVHCVGVFSSVCACEGQRLTPVSTSGHYPPHLPTGCRCLLSQWRAWPTLGTPPGSDWLLICSDFLPCGFWSHAQACTATRPSHQLGDCALCIMVLGRQFQTQSITLPFQKKGSFNFKCPSVLYIQPTLRKMGCRKMNYKRSQAYISDKVNI